MTGLADALVMCGLRYGTPRRPRWPSGWMAAIETAAYRASVGAGAREGRLPAVRRRGVSGRGQRARLPEDMRAAHRHARHPQRPAHLHRADRHHLAVRRQCVERHRADLRLPLRRRKVLEPDGSTAPGDGRGLCLRALPRRFGAAAPLPEAFVTADEIAPARASRHAGRGAAPCRFSSISKTINCPADMSFADFKGVYAEAYDSGPQGLHHLPPQCGDGLGAEPPSLRARRAAPWWRPRPDRRAGCEEPLPPGLALAGGRQGAGRLHGQAAGARRRAARLHLQAEMAGLRSRHLHHHQRHRVEAGPAAAGRSRSSSTRRTWSTMPGPWR